MRAMVLMMPSQRMILLVSLFVCMIQLLTATAASAGPPTPGNFDGPAELPRIFMRTAMHDTPTPGKMIRVQAGEDASAAVEKASCGDTVQLQAGATFRR